LNESAQSPLDEALIAITLVAFGYGSEWVRAGGKWWGADDLVTYFRLEEVAERVRSELIFK
jgi:hypothetical protein